VTNNVLKYDVILRAIASQALILGHSWPFDLPQGSH